MSQHRPAPAQVCPNCHGFSAVRVALGGRDRSGALRTITTHSPACHGIRRRRPALARQQVTA
ncbi:hypothetical protein ABZ891_37160 [Streptomyces sp. NPDC047023]|uniref:hypothetical protein n=1 Tax=Streptomyces sp. NPDC047023 TaxID=3155139 RepID=UPI0033F0DA5D